MQNILLAKPRIEAEQVSHLIEENLNAKSMDFGNLPGGKSHLGNPSWFLSGLDRASYNGITCARFNPEKVDQQIEAALEPFRQLQTPLTWWVGPLSAPANLGRALQAHGFCHNRDMIGMAAELDALAGCVPTDLEYCFEPVLNRADLKAWMPLFMETFGIPVSEEYLTLDVFDQLSFQPDAKWLHYLIRVEGEVVATSSLHVGAGVAGLYNIATKRAYRQHGLGTTITLLTFEQARKMGYTVGTLQTTYPNALRLYHRMGFEVYCKFGIYQKTW